MFQVLSGRRTRRVWGPGTVALSVLAHALVFGGAAVAASRPPVEIITEIPLDTLWPAPETPRTDPAAEPDPAPRQEDPRPVPADEPPATPGTTLQLPAPTDVPSGLPPVDPDATPVNAGDVSGVGPVGDVIGTPPARPTEPTGGTVPASGNGDGVYAMSAVEELPTIADRREAARLLERHYPGLLRDAEIGGRVTVRLVLGADGRVVPGSIHVVEATHDGFAQATLRVVERMRFRPAKVDGRPVPVSITLPIDWVITP